MAGMLPQRSAFLKFTAITEHSRHHHNTEAEAFPRSPKFLDSKQIVFFTTLQAMHGGKMIFFLDG
jgi:hypothetical protein